jgi:epoxide hydrolase-like predicted phosphatase
MGNSNMIRALIFDVGGVLIRTPDRSARLAWERRLGLKEWETEEIVFGGEMGTRAQLGEITDTALWTWIGQRLALTEQELAIFRQDFWSGDVLDLELVDYIRSQRKRFRTGIISNATDALRETLRHTYPIATEFDLIVVSAEEGIMKPDDEIYLRTLERLNVAAREAVFVDDNLDNVLAAQNLGLSSIHFSPALDLPAVLAEIGISGP